MRLLLDTHALLWWLDDSSKLTPHARSTIADSANELFVSAATIWEISIKRAKGRLRVPFHLLDTVEQEPLLALPITLRHADAAGRLPRHHADPFDRLLIAQAMAEGLTVVTRDPIVAAYGVPVIAA